MMGGGVMYVLPKANEAVIPLEKFVHYVLSPKNSKGKHVAFERALGYNLDNVTRHPVDNM